MSGPIEPPVARLVRHSTADLQRLLDDMKSTKVAHRLALGGRLDLFRIESTRSESLVALEAYVSALDARGLPIPPPLHRDLDLLRRLCAPSRRRHR